jgi:hypothetical protein
MRKGYLFHSEFNDADDDTALFGHCTEVLRIDNCTAWRPMSDVMDAIPRVVHPDGVKGRSIHVAFRDLHFVCGVSCIEDVKEGKFTYRKLKRANFHMYPEERCLRCPSIIRIHYVGARRNVVLEYKGTEVMTNSGDARSGSFCVAWTSAHMKFMEVAQYKLHVFV